MCGFIRWSNVKKVQRLWLLVHGTVAELKLRHKFKLSDQKWTLKASKLCYTLEIQPCQRETTSKMKLRIKPYPAVALILQHLRFEARLWCCWFIWREQETYRQREKWVNNGLSFNTRINSKQVKITEPFGENMNPPWSL